MQQGANLSVGSPESRLERRNQGHASRRKSALVGWQGIGIKLQNTTAVLSRCLCAPDVEGESTDIERARAVTSNDLVAKRVGMRLPRA